MDKVKPIEIASNIINTLNHCMISIASVYMTYLAIKAPYRLHNLHVIFTTLGFQLLMAEAILVFYANNTWSNLLRRPVKNHVHWILQAIGAALNIAGMVIEIYIKDWKLKWTNNHVIFGKYLVMCQ